MKLAIDIDGVLRNFCESLIEQYGKDYPDHKVGFINKWELEHFFPIGKGIYDYAFKIKAKEVFENAEPFAGARWFTEQLRRNGHYVCLLTQQPKGAEVFTLNWIQKHGIAYDSIAFSKEKELFNYDILLDDAEHNLRAARSAGRKAVCMSRPYNKNWDGERVSCWAEFLILIQG